MSGVRMLHGKILEPSAGKGDMINHIKTLLPHRFSTEDAQIDAIEKDEKLSSILMQDGMSVVWNDFLTYETFKEYDFIIMNPPFSDGVDHALKAIKLAESQISYCEIYMILNKETINNAYSTKRQELLSKLDKHDAKIRYVKGGFTQAERKTDVETALIHVSVDQSVNGKSVYDRIPFRAIQDTTNNELTTALSTHLKASEIQSKLNDIERLVLEYETACKVARSTYKAVREKESFFNYISQVNKQEDEMGSTLSIITSKKFHVEDINTELDRLRRGYWELILDTKDFRELLTNEARQKLNRQISAANEMEINFTNIKMLLTALAYNQQDILIDSIVSIFKRITKHHMNQYSSNIHMYNGWKTNDAYKVNHKIIIPISHGFEPLWDFKEDFNRINMSTRDFINDLIRALQLIDPDVSNEFNPIDNQEFENDSLRFKMFLKGTVHIWFKDLELLNKLNYLCGQHFNWIPSDAEQEESEQARKFVAKEFGDVVEVELLAI